VVEALQQNPEKRDSAQMIGGSKAITAGKQTRVYFLLDDQLLLGYNCFID